MGSVPQSLIAMGQPRQHFKGSDVVYSGGVWKTRDYFGNTKEAKSFYVKSSSSGGNLVVHLVEDPQDKTVTLEIPSGAAGYNQAFVFDQVYESGTTIALADLTFWL